MATLLPHPTRPVVASPFTRLPKLAMAGLLVAVAVAACDENPPTPPLGSLGITTSTSPATLTTTADGWALKFNRFLVNITAVNVAGVDRVLAASATALIVDEAAPGPKDLTATVRTARQWEDVNLLIGPTTTETTSLIPPVAETDREMMQREGFSLYLEATLTKEGVSKALKLGFTTTTLYKDCAGELNGQFVRGLIVPAEGIDIADVAMDPSILFTDDLAATGALPRADAIAGADKNNDGIVTLAELRATPLDAAKETGGLYGVGELEQVADLGAFVEELSRRTVTSFRAKGACIPESQ